MGTAFSRLMETMQSIPRSDMVFRTEVLKTIKRIFVAHPSIRDTFRQVGGYVTLVSMIVAMEDTFTEDKQSDLESKADLMQEIFAVLGESMRDHATNKHFFKTHVGYAAMENSLQLTGMLSNKATARHMFGILFAFAVDDQKLCHLFAVDAPENEEGFMLLRQRIDTALKDVLVSVSNPDVIPTIFQLQKSMDNDPVLSASVLYALYTLTRSSRRNQVVLNRSGLLLASLQRLFTAAESNRRSDKLFSEEKGILLNMIKKLMTMGVSYEEIWYLLRQFDVQDLHVTPSEEQTLELLDLVLEGATRSRWPNFIQFDMSARGYSCLEIRDLREFSQQSSGYTLMFWFHIERLDKTSPIILLSLSDEQRTLLRIQIGATSRRLQVQCGTNKQIIEFGSIEIQSGYWYHLGLVHQKSRLGSNLSTMTMFINGIRIEQNRCPYLSQPLGQLSATIGTPPDAAVPGSRLIWNLGPAYLSQEILEDDQLLLYFNLGARYKSLFLDSLRQFQTYEASTALFMSLRNITKSFGRRDSQSMLTNVMRGSSQSGGLDEKKLIFALFAPNAVSAGSVSRLQATGSYGLNATTVWDDHFENPKFVLNAAISKFEDALCFPKATGRLVGNPVVAYPCGMDDSIWRVGGCSVPLLLIEKSEVLGFQHVGVHGIHVKCCV